MLFGGGIFYYFALRYDDIRRAKHCLIAGIASLVLWYVVPAIVLAAGGAGFLG